MLEGGKPSLLEAITTTEQDALGQNARAWADASRTLEKAGNEASNLHPRQDSRTAIAGASIS